MTDTRETSHQPERRPAERGNTSPSQRERSAPTVDRMTTSCTLNNDVEMPALGLGVFQTPPDETRAAVEAALATGYRHIDTAAAYGNEREVGRGDPQLRASTASEVFIETKIWISDYGYDETLHGFDKSAGKLGVDQIDLLILHQALPSTSTRPSRPTARWRRCSPTARSGPSASATSWSTTSPRCSTRRRSCPRSTRSRSTPTSSSARCRTFGAQHGILTQAWSPIGGITFYRDGSHGSTLEDPVIGGIAEAHGKTPAQVMLRWHLQQGRSAIPKSTKPHRIAENFDVFDFDLTADELAAIDALDTGQRGGPEPEDITLESFGRPIPEA